MTSSKSINPTFKNKGKGVKPLSLSSKEMLSRFRDLENLSISIYNNPYKFLKNSWNHIDMGIVLLGCNQLEKSLFPPHKSGKTFLNLENPFVNMLINQASRYMEEENLILVDGKPFEKQEVK